ncbi:hypothetical protein TSO5_15960 [Azospirillum sp. TSO5]|nr:hypothetical protein TSO5_15960 [Azospirillum sp. TSO5]
MGVFTESIDRLDCLTVKITHIYACPFNELIGQPTLCRVLCSLPTRRTVSVRLWFVPLTLSHFRIGSQPMQNMSEQFSDAGGKKVQADWILYVCYDTKGATHDHLFKGIERQPL